MPNILNVNRLCLFPAANFKEPRLADRPVRRKSLVDNAGGGTSCPALHHPHLYGPADHCSHHQPKGAQAQGQSCLCAFWWCPWCLFKFLSVVCIPSLISSSAYCSCAASNSSGKDHKFKSIPNIKVIFWILMGPLEIVFTPNAGLNCFNLQREITNMPQWLNRSL